MLPRPLISPRFRVILGFLPIFFAVTGIIYNGARFPKIHLGPLYILEICFLFWLVWSAPTLKKTFLKSRSVFLVALLPVLAFFLWGCVRAFPDIQTLAPDFSSYPFERFVRHCMLFFYPLIWISMGIWLRSQSEISTRICLGAILILHTMINFSSLFGSNLSIGPIFVVPFLYCLHALFEDARPWLKRWDTIAGTLITGFLALYPFWQMRHLEFQRVSLLLFFIDFCVFQVLFLKQKLKPVLKSSFLLFLVGLAGFFYAALSSDVAKQEATHPLEKVKVYLYQAFQHGEDKEWNEDGTRKYNQFLRFESRKFWWNNALEQWKLNPIAGVGFIPEIPTHVQQDIPNDGVFGTLGAYKQLMGRPLSGPHNSYLTVLARMGLVGISLLALILLPWFGFVKLSAQEPDFWKVLLVLIPLNGLIHATFQMGFESPSFCAILWLTLGLGLCEVLRFRRNTP